MKFTFDQIEKYKDNYRMESNLIEIPPSNFCCKLIPEILNRKIIKLQEIEEEKEKIFIVGFNSSNQFVPIQFCPFCGVQFEIILSELKQYDLRKKIEPKKI